MGYSPSEEGRWKNLPYDPFHAGMAASALPLSFMDYFAILLLIALIGERSG
ncbi:MAG TPA: hypothetical protein VH599_03465 [Ktedonobacterales bacterium]